MRIARDPHDAAGHGVTAISLQAATGLRAIEDGADIDEARHVLEEIKRTSRIALEDMRKLLGLLRPALPPILDQTAYRIIQESLTNVLKHAGSGAPATVGLSIDPTSVELEVTDDGPGKIGGVAAGTRRG
jgi:signal transduction histidine kinase